VCGLLPNSAAMDCGKITIGDQIIEVNGIDMRQATVDEAADIMVNCMTLFHVCPFMYNIQCFVSNFIVHLFSVNKRQLS